MVDPDQLRADVEAEALRRAQAFVAQMSADEGVGDRHHTVPRFWLERFATGGQVDVRDMITGALRRSAITDLAVRDFYTAVVDEPDGSRRLDGRIEKILAHVEGEAADALRRVDDDPDRPRDAETRRAIAQLLAFQFVRGMRKRMEVEYLAEFHAKTMLRREEVPARLRHRAMVREARRAGRTPARGNGRRWKNDNHQTRRDLSDEQLRALIIRPHPNEHMKLLGTLPEAIYPYIACRPMTIVTLDRPLLNIGDEPVAVIDARDLRTHLPSCRLTDEQRRRELLRAIKAGRESREVIHIYPTRRVAVALAESVVAPIANNRALILGGIGTTGPNHTLLSGDDAVECAREINTAQLEQAYLWIAGTPGSAGIDGLTVPPRKPLFEVCDDNNAAREALVRVASDRPRRVRRSDIE